MKRLFFNTLIVILLLLCPAMAGEALTPVNFKGIYICTFSGIPIGKMGIEIEQSPDHYAIADDITTSGLLRLFVKHQSHSTVEAGGHDFSYPDVTYETHYQTRKKKHYIKLVKKNGRVEETQIPPESHATRPAVPEAMLRNAVDPLSFIIATREKLQEATAQQKSAFSVDVYDGNRLSEANFTILGKKTIYYGAKKLPVIAVSARQKPLAGFTKKEMADFKSPQPALTMYFSDDAKLMPLKLQMALPFGLLTATLSKECLSNENCLLGIK